MWYKPLILLERNSRWGSKLLSHWGRLLPRGGATLGQATPLARGDGGTQDRGQGRKPEGGGLASPAFASERGWKNWATPFVGHLFSTQVAKFQFQVLSFLTVTCQLVQRSEQERWWAVGDRSSLAVLGSLLPCAHACSSSLPTLPPGMGQEGNAKLCLHVAYLFHSPATSHLFTCCSGVHAGERLLAVSASQKMFGLWRVFLLFWKVVIPLLSSFFYSQSLWVYH